VTRYSIHPMEKNYNEWETKQRQQRNEYWLLLRRLKREWEEEAIMHGNLEEYVRAVAGIEMSLIEGNISSTYEIVDPEQFLLCKLKYGI